MRAFALDEAELNYGQSLHIAGTRCDIRTNSRDLIMGLENWYASSALVGRSFSMQVFVTEDCKPRARQPHFRGLNHLVTACFGEADIFVFDLLRCNVDAVVTRATASDAHFWKRVVIPIAIGILGACLGSVPVHCACLAIDGQGLLIAGQSGAGKSTLALAMAKSGFTLVSDDWTYITDDGTLLANGLFAPVKLMPDTSEYFPELTRLQLTYSLNGELAFELSAEEVFGASVCASCRPRMFLFLERSEVKGLEISNISSQLAGVYLKGSVERIPAKMVTAKRERSKILARLTELPCYLLRYGGTPASGVNELRHFFDQQLEALIA